MRYLFIMFVFILLVLPTIFAFNEQLISPCFGAIGISSPCFPSSLNLFYFGKETITPLVTLIRPVDFGEDSDGIVDFFYQVTDSNHIKNCSIYLDNNLEKIDQSITKNIEQTFQIVPPVKESLKWLVSCTDEFNNQGNSSTFSLDTELGEGTPSPGGGGGKSTPETRFNIKNISLVLCNLTYDSANKDINKYTEISRIQEQYLNLTNFTVDFITVRLYIDNWMPICSNRLNVSLKEKELCKEIHRFIETDFDLDLNDVNTLIKNFQIEISPDLIIHYANNYKKLCSDRGFSERILRTLTIMGDEKLERETIWLIILFICLMVLIFLAYVKRRFILALFKKKKSK